jgi:hypothetical protein
MMEQQALDIWAERRGEIAVLVGEIQPEEALEVLQRVVSECTSSSYLAPVLMGTIRGIVERRQDVQRWRTEGGRGSAE